MGPPEDRDVPVLVLASTSPWRRKILEDAGWTVEVEAPGVDEGPLVGATPPDTAARRAAAKAEAVAARHRPAPVAGGAWILGADQVLVDGDEAVGKPRDPADHLARLRSLRGRPHDLVTAWSLRHVPPPGERPQAPADGRERTRLWMRDDLGDDELEAYVAGGEGRGCAGGYAIEGQGAFLFARVEGDWSNIVGLPLFAIQDALRARGWRFGPGGWR